MIAAYLQKIKASPLSILFSVLMLLCLGLATLFSIAQAQEQLPPNAFSKQIMFLMPATFLMIVMTLLSKRLIHKYIYLIYNDERII